MNPFKAVLVLVAAFFLMGHQLYYRVDTKQTITILLIFLPMLFACLWDDMDSYTKEWRKKNNRE